MKTYEKLTCLPGRECFEKELSHTIALANQEGSFVAVFLINISFKDVTACCDILLGDQQLTLITTMIQKLRVEMFVAKFSDDKIGIILKNAEDEFMLEDIANHCLTIIKKVLSLETQKNSPQVSIGISQYPIDGETSEDLLQSVVRAMYAAKTANNRNLAFYNNEINIVSKSK